MTIPEYVTRNLQPRLVITWIGRRAAYEIVEEVSEAIFKIWVITSLGLWIQPWVGQIESYSLLLYWLGWLVIMFLFALPGILEVMNWWNEIYVVTRDPINGAGRVYRFFGWLDKRVIDEPVTPQSPTMITDMPFAHRLWKWITGESMMRVMLKSQNHTFLEGQRISSQFARAIKDVRGFRPAKQELGPTNLAQLDYLDQHRFTGLLRDHVARDAAETIVQQAVYGE